MSGEVSYTHRLNALTHRRTYRITDDALVWDEDDGESGRLAYADIRGIRLAYRPSRAQPDQYLATIIPRSGKQLRISNTSYRGFNDFVMHDGDYSAFLKTLHARLEKGGYHIAYRKGISPIGFLANLVLTSVIIGGVVALLYFVIRAGYYNLAAVKLLIVIWYMPLLFRMLLLSQPQRYAPDALPDDALPWAGRSAKARRAG